jgi:polysaccharide export outer membrane protein
MKRAAVLVVLCFVVLAGAIFAEGITAQAQEKTERFYVTGYVKTPGSFVLEPGMSVNQAIAVAGGITERGSTRGIKISRKVDGQTVEVDAALSDLVQPNDTIRVRQRLQ